VRQDLVRSLGCPPRSSRAGLPPQAQVALGISRTILNLSRTSDVVEDEERWRLDNGTPLYVLRLRRHMGSSSIPWRSSCDRPGRQRQDRAGGGCGTWCGALAAAAQVYALAAERTRATLDEARRARR